MKSRERETYISLTCPRPFAMVQMTPPLFQRESTETSESCEAVAVRKSYWVLLIFVLIGGLLGGVLGEILRVMAPHGTIQSIFATNFTPGISPFSIDLVLLKFTLGFELKINLLSLLGMFLGIYLYKNV
jgi:hypothetical protein